MTRNSPLRATASGRLRWHEVEHAKPPSLAKVLPLLRAAVDAAPDRVDLKRRLAKALFQTDQMAEIVERFRTAVADDAADAEFLYYLGRAALVTRDNDVAVAALERATAKGFGRAYSHLAAALLRLGRADEGLAAALQDLKDTSSDFASLPAVARALLGRGEAERLWALCVDLRARGAWGGWLPAVMAFAAAMTNCEDELAALVNPDRWFAATELDVREDFNERLAAELLAHKSLSDLPLTKASRGTGDRIDKLQVSAGPLAHDLLARIREAIEAYVAERHVFSDDPMMMHSPTSVALDAWALALHDDGRVEWHIHPSGWISGVYYVKVPEAEPDDDAHPGAIEFGLLPFGQQQALPRPRWQIIPREGLLLLFPSWYAHRTRPTSVGEPRICVAFDVCPSIPEPQ
jgi:tetratricopeptide (TPR) repeat protein